MNKTLALATALAATLAFAGAASAATCKTKFLTGVWVGTANADGDDYCVVQFNTRGWIIQANCFDPASLKPTGTFDGRFTATPACKVAGNYDVIPVRGPKVLARFTGTLDPETGLMKGRVQSGSQPAVQYTFRQQW